MAAPTNNISVNSLLARNAVANFYNNLGFVRSNDRQAEEVFKQNVNGYKAGKTVTINRLARYKPVSGNAMPFDSATGTWTVNNFVEDPITLTLSTADQMFIPLAFDSLDLTTRVANDDVRIGAPAGETLAQYIEQKIINETVPRVGNGFIASTATALAPKDLLVAQARLSALATPEGRRFTMINPFDKANLANAGLTLFIPQINEDAIKGELIDYAGARLWESNLGPIYDVVPSTTGTVATTPTNGATSIALSGLNPGVYKAGTIIEFNSTYRVNPITKAVTSVKYQIALSADMTATGSAGTATGTAQFDSACAIYDSTDSGNRQNVSAFPASSSAITVIGSTTKQYRQTVMYSEDAFTSVILPLTTDLAGVNPERMDHDGFSIRVIDQMIAGTDQQYKRFDVLGKGIVQRDTYAVRILTEAI